MQCFFLAACALTVSSMLAVQPSAAQSLVPLISRLETSEADTAKENALTALVELERIRGLSICSPVAALETRQALIRALGKENRLIVGASDRDTMQPGFSETELEYYAGLVGCVSQLRDQRALPELIGAIQTGGGAIQGIVRLGEPAVPALIQYLRAPRGRGRIPALMALGQLAAPTPLPGSTELPPSISREAATAIRARLLVALDDSSVVAREVAIEGLRPYRDAQVLHAIERKAATDPSCVQTNTGTRCAVRDAARAWLRQQHLR